MLLLVLAKDENVIHMAENTFLPCESLVQSPLEVLRGTRNAKGQLVEAVAPELGDEGGDACGTWQFCLHNDEPCGFVTFLCVSVATHVTARGVRVITMKRRIRFGSVRG